MGVTGKSDTPQKIRQNSRHNQGKPGRWQGYKKAFEVPDNPSSLFRANHVTVNSYCWFKSPLNIASKPQWFRHGGTWGLGGVIRTQRLSGWKRRHCGGGGRKLMETSVRRGLGVRRKSEWFQGKGYIKRKYSKDVCMYVCMHACMHVCMYKLVMARNEHVFSLCLLSVCIYVCIYICKIYYIILYVYMCVCVCVG